MAFSLPPLPFEATALAPHISAETLEFHHGKHHKAYIDKVNGWIDEKELKGLSLVDVLKVADASADQPLFNNAAQIWNHSFYWSSLAPEGGTKPSGALQKRIDHDFGSSKALIKSLADEAVGHFSNGWAWLVLDGDTLKVTSYHDADTPVIDDGSKPLFALDVWEHAYYIDYRNARPEYAEAVLGKIVNWDFISQNLDGNGVARADQPAG